eukprot:1083062-Pyramimonas_sp.AAC.1
MHPKATVRRYQFFARVRRAPFGPALLVSGRGVATGAPGARHPQLLDLFSSPRGPFEPRGGGDGAEGPPWKSLGH